MTIEQLRELAMGHNDPVEYMQDVIFASVSSSYPERWPKTRDMQRLLAEISAELIILEDYDGNSTSS